MPPSPSLRHVTTLVFPHPLLFTTLGMDFTIGFGDFSRYYVPISLLSILITLACVYYGLAKRRTRMSAVTRGHKTSLGESRILKCKISHRRLFPAQHAFVYSCLSVCIPVRKPASNWILSVDAVPWWKRGWLHVSEKDHLNRGREGKTLSENLNSYLRQQGLDPSEFPHVYLFTTASFLHYSFSPASFWYLYSTDFRLHYVLAEVNNTFGERRMYLFPAPSNDAGEFRQSRAKDFHVSPFSSRKGSYTLSTTDPALTRDICVKIVLSSSKGHPKLVARWWSDEPALDPLTSSTLSLIWYLVRWGWTTLITFPRILLEAILLAQVHKLQIWYRPEPNELSIPRQCTSDEQLLASVFVKYLRFLLDSPPKGLDIIVQSPGVFEEFVIPQNDSPTQMHPPSSGSERACLELRIHTPQFYRQMINSGTLTEFLTHTLLHPWKENRTAWSNDETRLLELVQEAESIKDEQRRASRTSQRNFLKGLAWHAYRQVIPIWPISAVYPSPGLPKERTGGSSGSVSSPSPPAGVCFLQEFVRDHCSPQLQAQYVICTLGLQWRTWIMNIIGGE